MSCIRGDIAVKTTALADAAASVPACVCESGTRIEAEVCVLAAATRGVVTLTAAAESALLAATWNCDGVAVVGEPSAPCRWAGHRDCSGLPATASEAVFLGAAELALTALRSGALAAFGSGGGTNVCGEGGTGIAKFVATVPDAVVPRAEVAGSSTACESLGKPGKFPD